MIRPMNWLNKYIKVCILCNNAASSKARKKNMDFAIGTWQAICYANHPNSAKAAWPAPSQTGHITHCWISLVKGNKKGQPYLSAFDSRHCRMRDKSSMFLSPVFKKLIFLCSFLCWIEWHHQNFLFPTVTQQGPAEPQKVNNGPTET